MWDVLIIVSLETQNCKRVLAMKGDSVDLGLRPACFWHIFAIILRIFYVFILECVAVHSLTVEIFTCPGLLAAITQPMLST